MSGAQIRIIVGSLGILAIQCASGAIVYTDVEDFNVVRFDEISIDLNGDGIDDFHFKHRETELSIIPFGSNGIFGIAATPPNLGGNASALVGGSFIGQPEQPFSYLPLIQTGDNEIGAILAFCVGTRPGLVCGGEFRGNDAYIGLRFDSTSGEHFGWLRFDSTTFFGAPGGTVRNWAYETIPGKSIVAAAVPEPASGFLVLCGMLLFTRRRRSNLLAGRASDPMNQMSAANASRESLTTVSDTGISRFLISSRPRPVVEGAQFR